MKLRWDNQHVRWGVTSFLVIAASMLFYYGVFHMKTLITGIQTFLGILTPIVYGVVTTLNGQTGNLTLDKDAVAVRGSFTNA